MHPYSAIILAAAALSHWHPALAQSRGCDQPAFLFGPVSQSVCTGETVTLSVGVTGTGPFTFTWQLDGQAVSGATSSTLTLKNITGAEAGAYDVLVENACGSATSSPATISVSPDIYPQIQVQPPYSQTVCQGEDVTFDVSAIGTALTYQWTRFESTSGAYVDIAGAQSASYTLSNAALADETVYRVRISNSCGQILSINSSLNVDDGVLSITRDPLNTIACDGGSALLDVLADGTDPLAFQWRKNGTPISGANSWELEISPVTFQSAGNYDVVVTSVCGTSVTSSAAVLTVTALDPTTILTQPTSMTVCEGAPAVFSVDAIGAAPLQYQWRHHGADIPGETGPTLTIPAATSADACRYDVLVRGPCGAVLSASAELTVQSAPTLIRPPQSRLAALDEDVVLSVDVLEAGVAYQWFKDGSPLSGETARTFSIVGAEASDSGPYSVRVTGGCGVTESAVADLLVSTTPFTERVSVSIFGVQADDRNERCSISADGQVVAYESRADNLVSGIPDDSDWHVFARDRKTGTTFQVDANSFGRQLNAATTYGEMSGNIQWTAYVTTASNVVVGDNNGLADVFLLNRVTGEARRISIRPGFGEANGASGSPSISEDGRWIAFESAASNLIASDGNGASDVFLYDRDLNTLRCISVTSGNQPGNGPSGSPSISDDGLLIAFHSAASNLVSGDTNGASDIFIYDVTTSTVSRSSLDSLGVQANGPSVRPSLSGAGDWLAFESAASNLVAGDTNGASDVFAVELATGLISRCSVASGGQEIFGDSNEASIANNGRWLAFSSKAGGVVADDQNGYRDVFVIDRDPDNDGIFDPAASITRRLSKGSASGPDSDGASSNPRIADNGGFVAFQSVATNLVDNDTNCRSDIFTASVNAASPARVSIADDETQGLGDSVAPTISGDPHLILFSTTAPDMTPEDFNGVADLIVRNVSNNSTDLESRGWRAAGSSINPSVSANGRYIAFETDAPNLEAISNNRSDVFRMDLTNRSIVRVSLTSAGVAPNDNCYEPSVSDDGRYVAFVSTATNLSPADANNRFDVYRRDLQAGQTILISVNNLGEVGDGPSERPAISGDGRYVAFQSLAANLIASDTNGRRDIFVRDVVAGTTTRVSVSSAGLQANHDSTGATISSDGARIAFQSFASNLVAGDTLNTQNSFVHVRATGETISIDSRLSGGIAESGFPTISRDGQFVSFSSFDADLVIGDTNSQGDIFLRDLVANTTSRASVDNQGLNANGESYYSAISNGGRFVAFTSEATNLVPGDTNVRADIFVHSPGGCLSAGVLAEPLDQNVAIGQQIVLAVQGLGTGPLTYQWYFEDQPVAGAVQASYVIPQASLEDGGSYYAEVANACGLAVTRTVTVTVEACAPTVAFGSLLEFGGDTLADSGFPAISADGRYVAFHTTAGLSPFDSSNQNDVYVHDRLTKRFIWASRPVSAFSPNNASYAPSISSDGRFVAFQSSASNLIAGDTNGFADVFVYDRDPDGNGQFDEGNATLARVSLTSVGGQISRDSLAPSISDDGRFVAFQTSGAVVGPAGTDRIYVRDRLALTTTLVSLSTAGAQPSDSCTDPEISGDGRFVCFTSRANNLAPNDANLFRDIYVHDRDTGVTSLVSVSNDGQSLPGEAINATISRNGRRIAFMSNAALTVDDTNGVSDIYVRDRFTQSTLRISRSPAGGNSNGPSQLAAISDEGNFVAYYSDASNLALDADTNGVRDAFLCYISGGINYLMSVEGLATQGNAGSGDGPTIGNAIAVAENGFAVAFVSLASNLSQNDIAERPDVFVRIVDQELTSRVSALPASLSVNGVVSAPSLSLDGRYMAFESQVNGIVPEDANGKYDVFVRDRLLGVTTRVTNNDGDSRGGTMSADGRWVIYYSDGTNAVPGDTNGRRDVFAYDMVTGMTGLVSRASNGDLGIGDSGSGVMGVSSDGRYVAFESSASNFTSLQASVPQIYVRDRDPDADGIFDESNSTTAIVTVNMGGDGGGGSSPRISGDGRIVLFRTNSAFYVPNDTNQRTDIFQRDMQTGVITRVSLNSAGVQSNENAANCEISLDGRICVWDSAATNLDPLATNGLNRVFARDLTTGVTFLVSRSNSGAASNSSCQLPRISANGDRVAYESFSTNLSPADTDSAADIYLYDLTAQTTSLISVTSTGGQVTANALAPAISPDGDFIAYTTTADMTAPEDNRGTNAFLVDRRGCTAPLLLSGPQSQFVPEGVTVSFNVVADASPPPTFVWRRNGVPIPNSDARTLVIEDVDAGDIGTYDVHVSNRVGTTVSATAQLGIGVLGDLNCDGVVSVSDIGPFVLALTNPSAYAMQFPTCDLMQGDINKDGLLSVSDIGPFVQLLTGGFGPPPFRVRDAADTATIGRRSAVRKAGPQGFGSA